MKAKALLKPQLDWLLILVPIALYINYVLKPDNKTMLFLVACGAILPLAGKMGEATEHLAAKMGQGIGGLLNATFGNAAELIIAMIALKAGKIEIVKASITGSIIGNILLVLGLSFLCGGLKYREQIFNRSAARTSATLLTLSAVALAIPKVFHAEAGTAWTPALEQRLSLAIAIVLIVTYIALLIFSLRTHKQLFAGHGHSEAPAETETHGETHGEAQAVHANADAEAGRELDKIEAESGHGHGAGWSAGKSAGVLLLATVFVALISEALVGAVESARQSFGFTEVFVGVIVVAIIGNAAEHSTAILMAMRNKMDLSIGIAVGSSIQIALFVAPVLVFASYAFGTPMDLEFSTPEILAMLAAVGIVGQISGDGESNWLEGAQLLSVYIILGILFYYLPEVHHAATGAAGAATGTGSH